MIYTKQLSRTISFLLVWTWCATTQAQLSTPVIPSSIDVIYPALPVEGNTLAQLGFERVTQWYETYQRGETDESGLLWSTPLENYQSMVVLLAANHVEQVTYYKPDNTRLRRLDYYYINGLVSAIDEMHFDSDQNEVLAWTDIYFYESKGTPLQRVRQFPKDKGLRELMEFRFNENNQLTKQKTSYTGAARQPRTLALIETGKQLITWEYGQVTRRSVYQNYNELIESYEYEFDELQRLKRVRRYAENRALTHSSEYEYENDKLYRITTQLSNQPQATAEDSLPTELTYFSYNDNGFIERIIIEQGDLQRVYTYSYTKQ